MVLIDTSVWILYFRPNPSEVIVQRVHDLLNEEAAATTGMVVLELFFGAGSKREFELLRENLNAVHHIAVRQETWHAAGADAFNLRQKGINVPTTDILIARTALEAGCSVLHHDQHYTLIASVTGLKVETI